MLIKLWKKICANRTVYLFLLPSVLVMLLIVGYPLVNTIYYSFTDMTAETHNMDSPQGRKNTVQAVQELSVIVPNLKKMVDAQQKIIKILKTGKTGAITPAENRALTLARKQRATLIKKIKDIEVTTDDGLYSFGTYYDLNLDKLMSATPPAGAARIAILKFEQNILSGQGGLLPRYMKEARTLVDKKKKHPTRFIGLRNFLILLGFKETDREIREKEASKGLTTVLTEAATRAADISDKKFEAGFDSWLKKSFERNAAQAALLYSWFNARPGFLTPDKGGKNARKARIQMMLSLIKQRAELIPAAHSLGNSIRDILLDLTSLLRRESRKKTAAARPLTQQLKRKIKKMKKALNSLYQEAITERPLLKQYLDIRYSAVKIEALLNPDSASLKRTIDSEEANLKTAIAIRSDHSSGFGFWDIFFQTIIWTIVNVFLHFTIGLYFAHWLNKRLKGNTLYRAMLMIPWTVPTFVAAFSWRLIFDFPDGILNRLIESVGGAAQNFMSDQWILVACIIVNVWVGVPFMMITLLGGLQTIPGEQYEAAEIDGANAFQKLMEVTLPGLKPVASVAVLLGFIWTFNMFNIIYLVTLGIEMKEKNILVTYAYDAFQKHFNFAESATYGVIILSLLLAFGSVYVRMLKKGGEV